jgi:hypothetical protein
MQLQSQLPFFKRNLKLRFSFSDKKIVRKKLE